MTWLQSDPGKKAGGPPRAVAGSRAHSEVRTSDSSSCGGRAGLLAGPAEACPDSLLVSRAQLHVFHPNTPSSTGSKSWARWTEVFRSHWSTSLEQHAGKRLIKA